MGTLFVDKLDPQSGTSLEIGSSGDTITIPSGATITNNGTQTGFGGVNTPAFAARLTSAHAVATDSWTKVNVNTEVYDTDNCYDHSTNYRFTPTTAGKYIFYIQVGFDSLGDQDYVYGSLYKNGSQLWTDGNAIALTSASSTSGNAVRYTITAEANGTSDYFELYGAHNYGSNRNLTTGWCFFGGYKLVE